MIDARRYSEKVLLRDGTSLHLRAIRPDDKERLTALFTKLSPESRYLRFMGVKKRLDAKDLAYFTELDFRSHVALVATRLHDRREEFVGVGRYVVTAPPPDRATLPAAGTPAAQPASAPPAELAFAVDDAYQRTGVGTLLLEHLAAIARAQGITTFVADVLGANNRMIDVFLRSGFKVTRSLEGGILHVSFPTEETETLLDAHDQREREATARSIRPILNPASVALVGASRHPGTIGRVLLENLRSAGFQGALYPVNPRARTLDGLRAYPSVSAIGAPVDLAIIAVPAAKVRGVIEDCERAGVHGVVVISSGFSESSEAGRALERSIRDLVRGSGMRMVGPNCMGVLNTDPRVGLNATFAPTWPPAGNLGMLSQSGALGIAILDRVASLGLGLSSFVSVGNKADVSGNDLISYWSEDPRTEVILLYLESFGNPQRFGRLAPVVGRRKPIVAVKSGRSTAGRRAAESHSAALATLDVAVDALFEQAGVIRMETLRGLFDVASLLSAQPVPGGPRVGVVTNAGGPAILLADACEAAGLSLPPLSGKTARALKEFLPAQAGLANPVDMIASASADQYERAMALVGGDPAVDALVTIYVPTFLSDATEVARAMAAGAGRVPAPKPVLTVFVSAGAPPEALHAGPRGRIPFYDFPESAARALAAAERYGRWRRRPEGRITRLEPFARSAVRAVIDRVLARAKGPVWLSQSDLATLLRAAGIEFAAAETITAAGAAEAAARLGFPLVAKAVAPGIVHKSDVGGVVLGLRTPEEVRRAVRTIETRVRRAGVELEGILLQREVPGGVEAFLGVVTDPSFGPVVLCGLGGVLVELLRDFSYRLPPVSDLEAEAMVDALRSRALLDGYRGSAPADRGALVKLIQRLSALVLEIPELVEMDLNPVKVLAPGKGAVAVDGRMRVAPRGWQPGGK